MVWFFIVLTAVVVIVIGLVSVGRVTFTLAEQPRPSSYELAEAVDFVADDLDDDVTAELSYEDVRTILSLHLDYLEVKGVAFESGTIEDRTEPDDGSEADDGGDLDAEADGQDHDDSVAAAAPAAPMVFPEWPAAATRGPLVADDDEALPYILGRLAEQDRDIDDVHVVEVLESERRYLEAIGAIGREVPAPTDPVAEPPSVGNE